MKFSRGDQVVHHNFGVGTIESIEEMDFSGNPEHLFYRVEFSKTTVWVPVAGRPTGGLRPVTPKSQLGSYRDVLKSLPIVLDQDFRQRQKELESRIGAGTLLSLCEIVRDLNARNRLKPLNNFEKNMFKQARESLVSEWSVANEQTFDEALEEIDGYLRKGRPMAASD